MQGRRMEKGMRNIFFSLGNSLIVLFLSFINRTVFIRLLSTDYLGLNGLFSNVLSFLALAELGVGSAMNYVLYRPLSENNTSLIKSIMALYKRFYVSIGSIVLLLGVGVTPFLPYLIKDMPKDMPFVSAYYCLYVLNSAISYFYTYKRALIVCDQKEYISYTTITISKVVASILQIVVLVITRNYALYLIVTIFCTFGENVVISCIANRLYPFLKDKSVQKLEDGFRRSIYANIYALIFHKIGAAVVFSTDNIIISKFVGLTAVGLYSNYTLLVTSINNILGKAFASLTASAGNLMNEGNKEHAKRVFDRILFANMWIYGLCSTCLLCLMQPFIKLWLGNSFLLDKSVLIIIVLNFYITGMRKTVWVFKDAAGVYREDQIKPVIEAILNIVFSIPLAIHFGVGGVLLGTILSTVLFPFWYEAKAFFNARFSEGLTRYIKRQMLYFLVWGVIGVCNYLLCTNRDKGDLISFGVILFICLVIPNLLIMILFWRTDECRYYRDLVLNTMHRLGKKERAKR